MTVKHVGSYIGGLRCYATVFTRYLSNFLPEILGVYPHIHLRKLSRVSLSDAYPNPNRKRCGLFNSTGSHQFILSTQVSFDLRRHELGSADVNITLRSG